MPGPEAPTGSVRGPDGQQEAELQGTDQMAPTATRGIQAYGAHPATQTRSSLGDQHRLEAPTGSGRVRGPDGQREAELQGTDQSHNGPIT